LQPEANSRASGGSFLDPGGSVWRPAALGAAGEHRVDESCGLGLAGTEIRVQPELGRKSSVGGCPLGWGRRKRLRKLVLAPFFEGLKQARVKSIRFETREGPHEYEVDEILDSRARKAPPIGPRVCVHLLGHVLLQRQRRDLYGLDPSEREEVGPAETIDSPRKSFREAS
jgi:hypothetical protein